MFKGGNRKIIPHVKKKKIAKPSSHTQSPKRNLKGRRYTSLYFSHIIVLEHWVHGAAPLSPYINSKGFSNALPFATHAPSVLGVLVALSVPFLCAVSRFHMNSIQELLVNLSSAET